MALVVGTNVNSLSAQRALAESSRSMELSMERLSTGKAINRGADDAAGLAKSMRMTSQIAGLTQASKNITEGKGMVSAMDTALEEVTDILVRMKELAVQSASDTTSATDRSRIQNEYNALKTQLDTIADNTRFNGQQVLNGTYTGKQIQIGQGAGETISVSQESVKSNVLGGFVFTSTVRGESAANATATEGQVNTNSTSDHFTLTVGGVSTWNGTTNFGAAVDSTAKTVAAEINALTGLHGITATARTYAYIDFGATSHSHSISITGGSGTATGIAATASATALTAMVDAINAVSSTTGVTAVETSADIQLYANDGATIIVENDTAGTDANSGTNFVSVDAGAFDGTRHGTATNLQASGSTNASGVLGNFQLTSASTFALAEAASTAAQNLSGRNSTDSVSGTQTSVNSVSVDSQANANKAVDIIQGGLDKVAQMRGNLGAIVNRLEHSGDSVLGEITSLESARSAILDADFSKESANLAKAQVLQQVGTAMLAQANAQPQLVLQLLQ